MALERLSIGGGESMESRPWIDIVEGNTARHGCLVAGIDPFLPDIPSFFEEDNGGAWIERYVQFLLDTIEGHVGFIKFQSAYFEACGIPGLAALSAGMRRARAAGIGVIFDAKRADIDPTASAYARAYLTPAHAGGSGDFETDCLTVNPLMGPDSLEPFVECVRRYGKGLLVICRTSNPDASWLQDRMAGNRSISDWVAELIGSFAMKTELSDRLSPIGAVVGATIPQGGRLLRQLLPRSIILAPGLGAQGGDPATIRSLRGSRPGDVLVPVSRGLTRVEDRSISISAYRKIIVERLDGFRQAVADGQPHILASTATPPVAA